MGDVARVEPASTPMRIVYVSWEYPPQFGGGIGAYVGAIAPTLARRGHDVTVLTIGDEATPAREVVDGVHIVRLPLISGDGEGPIQTLKSWQYRADALAETLRRMSAGEAIDLIEFCDYRGEGVAYLTSTTAAERPVCVVRLHTPLSVLFRYNAGHARQRVLEEYEHEAIRAADRVVSPSRALADEIRRATGDELSIDLSPHPVDLRFLDCDISGDAYDGDEILYVGRFEERKGVETLARAAEAFLRDLPAARLVMIGGDTNKSAAEPSMRKVVEGLIPRALRGRVEFIDRLPREELFRHYRSARICVFPSHFENFPNTCLESMALGRCTIGTTNSGMAEMIENGVSGVVATAQDVEALAAAVTRVWNLSDEQRRAMGCAARERIRTWYQSDVIAAGLERLYGTYIREHQPSSMLPRANWTEERPRVAVVIPCYNHGTYLPETLDSVRQQTYPHVECVVVNDGSTDAATLEVLKAAERDGVRVIHQDNSGLAAARNTGVRATDAPFFAPLDADDRIDPTFIETLLQPLLDDGALGYCYSHVRFFGEATGGWECPDYDPRKLLIENLSTVSAVVRRRAFDEAGGYQPDMIYGFEDWDFWIALLGAGYHGRCVPRPLFEYRKHAGGSMLSETQKRRSEMVRKMIEHHRTLFAATLEISMAGKDRLFFQAHTDAWRLREQLAVGGVAPTVSASTVDDELYQRLLARAELDHIENSRLWRMMLRMKRMPPVGWINRWRFGPDWHVAPAGGDPCARLAAIKSSATYRCIQAFKRLPVYRSYARWKYGAEAVGANAADGS